MAVLDLGQTIDGGHFLQPAVGGFQFQGAFFHPLLQLLVGVLLNLQRALIGGARLTLGGQGVGLSQKATPAFEIDAKRQGERQQHDFQTGADLRGVLEQEVTRQNADLAEHQKGVAQVQHGPGNGVEHGQHVALGPEVGRDQPETRRGNGDHQGGKPDRHRIADKERQGEDDEAGGGRSQDEPTQESPVLANIEKGVGEEADEADAQHHAVNQHAIIELRPVGPQELKGDAAQRQQEQQQYHDIEAVPEVAGVAYGEQEQQVVDGKGQHDARKENLGRQYVLVLFQETAGVPQLDR